MTGRSPVAWLPLAEDRELLRCPEALAWPEAPAGRRPRLAVLLADPEGRLGDGDVDAFARSALDAGCCWFEIWGPNAHALEARVDAVRDAMDAARPPPGEDEEDHVVMTASSTPQEARIAEAVRMVLCAACSTEGHGADRTSRLFVLASGDERFAEGLERWLRDPDAIP